MDKISPLHRADKDAATFGRAFPEDALEARLAHFGETLLARLQALNEQLLQEHHALKPLLSVKDVARTLAVSERTVEALIQRGRLRPLWVKGQRRFHPDAVDAYLRACEKRPRTRR